MISHIHNIYIFVLFLCAWISGIRSDTNRPAINKNASLEEVRKYNEVSRRLICPWITRSDWTSPPSLFNYGLPARVFNLIDKDVGSHVIEHDIVSYLGLQLEKVQSFKPIAYLEIGVSVGKCIFTQLNIFSADTTIFAFDIENINPSLSSWFEKRQVLEFWEEEVHNVIVFVYFNN